MNEDPASWNMRLLFASITVLLGLAGFVAGRSPADRRMTFGLLVQGILLAFVVGGIYLGHAPELRLGGMVVAVLLMIFSVAIPIDSNDEPSKSEDRY